MNEISKKRKSTQDEPEYQEEDICSLEIFENENQEQTVSLREKYKDCIDISSIFRKTFGSKSVNKRLEPNYFLCIKINNQQIVKAVDDCQKDILKINPEIKKAAIKIESLHVTLMAMHLKDKNQIDMINSKLNENKKDLNSKLNKNLELTFKGLSTFRNQVVYVDLEKDDHYMQLMELQSDLVKLIERMEIKLFEKNFTPHMTLMKLSKAKHLYKKGIKKINKENYEHLSELHFGVEPVELIHLCSIREKEPDGSFYKIEGIVDLKLK